MIQQQNMPPIYHEGLVLHNKIKFTFFFLTLVFMGSSITSIGQQNGFPFGAISISELTSTAYPIDTTASAIVLNEFGEAYINGNDFKLNFEYHVKIKILKKEGLDKGNFEIALRKNGLNIELIRDIEAVTFTLNDHVIVETKLDRKAIYTEDVGEYWELKKFTLPNVQVGSVIEIRYVKESPFIMNFNPWEFQSDIPKLYSEYWAKIPGNYIYSISLRGFYKLSKNESTLIKECLTMGSGKADCALNKYGMKNIPAFIEEDYSTASSNFISAIQFELKEIRYFDGRVDKVTKEWKDVDEELRRDPKFGVQLKKGKDIATEIENLVDTSWDDLTKAKAVFDFIKSWYRWNGVFGKYSEFGIKKAFDTKTGNVGDINLSLIAALRFAGLEVDPVVLSTRANGIVTDLHPVLSDFNYVIARFETDGVVYLLDATDDFMPFGLVPERCLNGKGRVLADKKSYWVDVLPIDKRKELSLINLKLEDGYLRGTIQNVFSGYEAAAQRKKVFGFPSIEEYFKDLDSKWSHIEIRKSELEYFNDLDKGLKETLDVEIDASNNSAQTTFFFNPFLIQKWEQNPFKSSERLYPVDFAYPLEWTIIVTLEIPESMQLEEIPQTISLALPENGGRYRLQVAETGNRITVQSTLAINRTIFSSYEYPSLKELFSRVIQAQNIDLVFISK